MSPSVDALVMGAGGMLGSHVARALASRGKLAFLASTARIASSADARAALDATGPRFVVNCIGYRGGDPAEHARVNGELPRALAEACVERGARLVHVSTNAVFPPSETRRWLPGDPIAPTTPYERAKAAGEDAARALVVRTSVLGRSPRGDALLDKLARGESVEDRRWNGVTALAFAEWLVSELEADRAAPGIVHLHASDDARLADIARLVGSTSPIAPAKKGPMLLGGGPPMPTVRAMVERYQREAGA